MSLQNTHVNCEIHILICRHYSQSFYFTDITQHIPQTVLKTRSGGCAPLIFGLYKKECQRLFENLKRQQWEVCVIHGDMSQKDREQSVVGPGSRRRPSPGFTHRAWFQRLKLVVIMMGHFQTLLSIASSGRRGGRSLRAAKTPSWWRRTWRRAGWTSRQGSTIPTFMLVELS
jgi:hypothetical protein